MIIYSSLFVNLKSCMSAAIRNRWELTHANSRQLYASHCILNLAKQRKQHFVFAMHLILCKRLIICHLDTQSVRLIGLEPTHRVILDPKSSASTNSATGASKKSTASRA